MSFHHRTVQQRLVAHEITLPVAGLDAIADLGRAVFDWCHRDHEAAASLSTTLTVAMQPTGAQNNTRAGRENARNGVQRLIDRFGGQMQVGTVRSFLSQTVRDLLGAPALVETFLDEAS